MPRLSALPELARTPDLAAQCHPSWKARLELRTQARGMVLKVAVEVGLSFGLVAGAKSSGGGHIETDVPETAGPQYCRDVLSPQVLLQSMRQREIRLQGDFVEDGLLVGHGSSRRL